MRLSGLGADAACWVNRTAARARTAHGPNRKFANDSDSAERPAAAAVHSDAQDASSHFDLVTGFDHTDGVDDAHDSGLLAVLGILVILLVILAIAVVGDLTPAIWYDGAERPALEPDENRPFALPAPLGR
jgi:hypothetical protein